MTGSFYRGLLVLKMIPHEPAGISTSQIRDRLASEHEIAVDTRTVQRDLASIEMVFPLGRSDGASAQVFWPRNCQVELMPSHDDYSALTWNLLDEYLSPLLPASMAEQARPLFDTARRYLEEGDRQAVRQWRTRVRAIPRSFELHPPDIDPAVQRAVYEALYHGDQLRVSYCSRGSADCRDLDLHPQALVVRESVFYLLARVDGYDDIRHFALHRMARADINGRDAEFDADFDLDAYIRSGAFAYPEGDRVDLVLRFAAYVGQHLLETKLCEDQSSTELDDGRLEIRARVRDTQQLRWWLLGFGAAVEVVAPNSLREFIREQARGMLARHDGHHE
ncbi:MAG: WYL domain-containing protein [Wenzhouxiangella sp.]|nr:MAG: WYL domain-containing protein [Wenzhouxiangella sp.]